MRGTKVTARSWPRAAVVMAVFALVAAGCNSNNSGGSSQSPGGPAQPPNATTPTLQSIGAGEGHLNLIAWAGYLDPLWVKPFETQTGCIIHAQYPNTSDEFVTLMKDGGGGQWDMASSSGDADLRIIYAGDAAPVNINLIPDWNNFFEPFKSPGFNTINGVHYGVSLQWGPNTLMYNPTKVTTAPTSWSIMYAPTYNAQMTVPDNPIQIADAALYLQKTNTSLGITDPYELTQTQFDAAINLLKQQSQYIKKYWESATQEIQMFKSGDAIIGASWPYQESQLKAAGQPIASTIPTEGATGWADTWMLAAKAPDPNCAYMWMKYISTPKAQAQQAVTYGETPVNKLACPIMDALSKGSCNVYHANDPSYLNNIALWKTPLATCDDGSNNCVPYSQWQQAWQTQVIQ
jgi:putative spermidine/putrescine transport system substrate-binding protein